MRRGAGGGARRTAARRPRTARVAAGPPGRRDRGLHRLDRSPASEPTRASTRCSTAGCRAPAYVTAAVAGRRSGPLTSPVDRAIWAWLAAAVAGPRAGLRALPRRRAAAGPPPYPSVADAGLAGDVRASCSPGWSGWPGVRTRRLSTPLVLDARGRRPGGRGASRSRCCTGPSLSLAAPGHPGAARRGQPGLSRARPDPPRRLHRRAAGPRVAPAAGRLGAGRRASSGFAVIDGVFVYQSAAGTFRPGHAAVRRLSLVVMALVAVGRLAAPASARAGRREPLPNVVLPALFALVCLGLLVFATQRGRPRARRRPRRRGRGGRDRPHRPVVPRGPVAGRAPARGPHRRADRAGQPAVVQRVARAGAGAGAPADRRLALLRRRPRRLQGRQRLPRPPLRGRAAPPGRPRACSRRCAAATWWRASAATSSPSCSPAPTARSAARIAERLRAGFRRPFRLGPRPQSIAPSVGIALAPDDGDDPVELLQHADLAMYEAKASRSGPGAVHRQAASLGPRCGWRPPSGCAGRSAAARWSLHYQPQVSLRTGAVTGRRGAGPLAAPGGGLVPPSGFLPQAESGG